MVKAYLKYVEQDITGGLVGNQSNIETCELYDENDKSLGQFMVSSCNEVINFTNLKTGEIQFKIFDKEALYGYITCIKASPSMIAFGFSSGNIQIYNLNRSENEFELLHQFSFHKSSVTSIIFFDNQTKLASGSSDTYIVIYDLIADSAQFKLIGHNEQITQLSTFTQIHPTKGHQQQILVSSSRDGLLKFWDIEQQSCILSSSDQFMSKIEDFCLIPELRMIVAGSSDNQLRLFRISQNKDSGLLECAFLGNLKKDSGSRILNLSYHTDLKILTALSADNKFEFYKLNIDKKDSLLKKLLRQEKRKALKRKKQEAEDDNEEDTDKNLKLDKDLIMKKLENQEYDLSIHFSKRLVFELEQKSKVKSVQVLLGKSKHSSQILKIYLSFHSNQIQQYNYDLALKKKDHQAPDLVKVFGELDCHKLPVRGVTIAENDGLMATNSLDSVKIWKIDFMSQQEQLKITCTQSIDQQNVLSLIILPGNKYVVMGTKEGTILLYDVQANELLQEVIQQAHSKEVWELAMHTNPQTKDARGNLLIASASSDKTIKFWTVVQSKSMKVQLQLYEKIETTDEVMGIKFTNNGKYFVFSLLDQTMKVCYLDTMKLSLNLYGHKLPILSFDLSSDNNLIVSASADKNIKIWGMDFGDIHKSIFAHQDSITCVKFIRDTHYFLSCSKDREVKYYDGDTYDEIFVFDNFFGEVWSLACSSIGDFFVAVSADKCIRVWRQTQEQVFLEEEKERREEKQMLKEAESEYQEIDNAKATQLDPFSRDKVMKLETMAATKKTAENLKYGEDLMEALELAESFKQEIEQYEMQIEEFQKIKGRSNPAKPKPSPLFNNRNIFDYILIHIKSMRSSEIENTLRFLNYKQSIKLIYYLEYYLRNNIEIETTSRCLFYILQTYQPQIQMSQELEPLLKSIAIHLRHHYKDKRDLIGVNVSALKLLQKEVSEQISMQFSNDEFRKGFTF